MREIARRSFLLLWLAVVAATPFPARAALCPISAIRFDFVGRSETAVAYGLTFASTSQAPVAAMLEVRAASGQAADLTLPATQIDKTLQTIFGWPGTDLLSARVKAFQPGGIGRFLPCSGSASVVVRRWAPSASTVVFAKGTLPVSKSLIPVDPSEPGPAAFVRKVEPTYPPEAVRAGIGGQVDVLVDVTPEGTASNVVVAESSQFAALDEAAVAAAQASTYKPPTINGRPASRRYVVSYSFRMGGANPSTKADTKCHARITHGWLIGLDRVSGLNLYEIGLGADRADVSSVDISLEKGDASPPTTFGGLAWERQPDGSLTTAVYVLNGGDLVASMRLESVDFAKGSSPMGCAPYTVATWDHTGGALQRGTRPTMPPGSPAPLPSLAVRPAVFVHRAWPRYPQSPGHDIPEGGVTLVVQVDPRGNASACAVYRSSESDALDAEASKAALASTYKATGAAATYVSWYLFRPTLTIGAITR